MVLKKIGKESSYSNSSRKKNFKKFFFRFKCHIPEKNPLKKFRFTLLSWSLKNVFQKINFILDGNKYSSKYISSNHVQKVVKNISKKRNLDVH